MRTALLVGLATALHCGVLLAQNVMTPEVLWDLSRVSGPEVSPDGRQVVFSVREYDVGSNVGNTDLYVMGSDGGLPQRLTDFPGRESGARWRPDGLMIGFLSDRSESNQLWEIAPDGSGLRQVTEVEGGIANFSYSPDGTKISFTARVKLDQTPQEIYPDLPKAEARIIDGLMYRHWDSWREYDYEHLFVATYVDGQVGDPVDVMPGERWDTPLNPFGGDEQISWTADGKGIAYTAKKAWGAAYTTSTNSDIYLYDLDSRETSNLTEGMMGYDIEPIFSPDGRYLAWLSMERDGYESDRNRIFVRDLRNGNTWELTEGFDQDAHSPEWCSDNRTIVFTSEREGTIQLYAADARQKTIRQITEGDHNYRGFDLAELGGARFVVAERQSISSPTELYWVDPQTGSDAQITFFNQDVMERLRLGRVERRIVEATDGAEIHTWVIYPPGFDPNAQYPALLYAQGGPQSTVSQFFSYRWNFQLMAANGYIVVAPNRRGVPSFGQEFKEEISGDWGGQAMQDLLSAIDDVAAEPYVDSERLGAVGASFGGYSMFWLAGHHEGRFKTFIAHAGVFNLESMYGATEEIFFPHFDLGGAYWDQPKPVSYDRFSPHRFVQNWDTPMLVIHGQKDFRVPVTEGMQAFTALQLKGIESRFLYFPNEGHWILSPQNGILWHRVFFDWLSRYLKAGTT